MKKFFNFLTIRLLLLTLLATFAGASPAWADELTIYNDAEYSSEYVPFYGYGADAVQHSQMIIPSTVLTSLNGKKITSMKFYYKKNETSGTNVGNWTVSLASTEATTLGSLDTTTPLTQVYSGAITPNTSDLTITITFDDDYVYSGGNLLVDFNHPTASGYKRFTFWCASISPAPAFSSSATRTYLPKTTFTYEDAPTGPAFSVKDGSAKVASPYAYNFGLTTAGATKVFKLTNPGTEATPISVDLSGANGFTATVEDNATSIPAGGEKTLTITMPDATASGSIVVTPTGAGLSAFTLNVSGTLRDPNKVYLDFSDGNMPDGWTSVATNYSSSTYEWKATASNGGYIYTSYTWGSSYAFAFTSPALSFEENETIYFETAKYSSSGSCSIGVEYSTNGTSWTAIGSAFTNDTYGSWTSRNVSIPTSSAKYIRFVAYNMCINYIYGGETASVPIMSVTEPATLGFGLYNEGATPAPTKTFTIANTGSATLSGISVSSANAAFTITNAPTSLAADASQEVTITMSTANVGALSSLITVSATDMEDATFTVTGTVKPNSMPVEEFTSGLPANWTNASWTFADGEATGKSSSAYLTTPKLTFSDGDLLIIKAKRYDSDSSDYLTVQGSNDNGSTWTAYNKKLQNAQGLTYPDYSNIVLNDIPTTVNRLRFVGYYCVVDEIYGLNYAPVLSVTKEAVAVNTPAAYDFGECAANASVTYNFANTGAGTINITNVAITGDGASAYSTNWTESTAAPFDLTITRTYDSSRAGTGAIDAVVTVTTTEGDFVINVTGIDKGANDPEFAIFIGEAEQTTGASLGFGTITENTVKTFKIKNDGTGALNVTAVTMPDADYTTDLESEPSALSPLVIAAGGSKTINVTLAASAKAIKSSKNITISAEGFEDFTFVADANVFPGAEVINFNNNSLPEGWTNNASNKWSFADGKAYCTAQSSSPAELVTKKLTFADDDFFMFSATSYDNYDNNYLEILGSTDNGETWTAFDAKKYISKSQIPYGSYATITVTGIPSTVNKLKFRGYYVRVDEIAGLVYDVNDPVIAVTDALDAAVASGTTKDFGWVQTAQSTTFKISNSGTGTLTISDITAPEGFTATTAGNVMTVSAGADPLVLTVTMAAGAVGVKSGTITLTTDGGDFTIPVKGFIYGDRNLIDFTNAAQYQGWDMDEWTVNDGIATPNGSVSTKTMQTTLFSVAAAEKLYIDIKGSTSNVAKSFSYSYSTDNGENWTDGESSISAGQYENVADQVLTISDIADAEAARTVLIRFTGLTLGINHIYGFEALSTPQMVLDKTADYNFGMQTAAAEYVITVTNTGAATLTNLAAALTTGTDYTVVITKPDGESTTTISEGKATVPAGQQAIITVTQLFDAANGLASFSDVLTISGDGVASEEINLSGQTRDGSKWYVDFASGIPSSFVEKGTWNSSSQQASILGESALKSQTLNLAANEKIQFDVKKQSFGTFVFKVRHSVNGGISWSDYTDLSSADGLNTSTYTTLEYSCGNTDAGIVAMIEILGSYAYLDNVYGGTQNNESPIIQVKKSTTIVANGTTEAFGSILAETTADYTFKNIGNGTLTITSPITTVTGDATAAVNSTSLAAGESATLTITMPVGVPYGEKSGAVTVKTNLGDFVINYAATTMDPYALYVDFSDGLLPTGWYNSGWSVDYSEKNIQRGYSGQPVDFITQKLDVVGTSDILNFDAKYYGSNSTNKNNAVLTVSYSTDRVNWTEISDYKPELTEANKTFSISGLAAGEYYLKFTGRYVKLDNIIGWRKVAGIEHDLYVTATSVPMTLAADYTATATVTSLRTAETGAYAKLFFGETLVATSDADAVALNGSTTFTMTTTEAPTVEDLYKAKIVVYFSDNSVAFTTGLTNVGTLVLSENTTPTHDAGQYGTVRLIRTIKADKWNTIVLPFNVSNTELKAAFGEDVAIARFTETASGTASTIAFTTMLYPSITANTPVLLKTSTPGTGTYEFSNRTVEADEAKVEGEGNFNFVGTYAASFTVPANDYFISSNTLYKSKGTTTLKGTRAYLENLGGAIEVKMFIDDLPTSIDGLMADTEENGAVYNLAGQRVLKAQKGIFVKNGRKVVVR